MRKHFPYLKDSSFLQIIDRMKVKEQYVKITVLDFQENPIREIQGKVVSGSVNLDGKSSVRRTCNLTMVADEYTNDLTNVDSLISMNKKVELQIGYLNTTDRYREFDILWFPLGVYVIITPNISRSNGGTTISLQLKDKMCLLNGECGGTFAASVELHTYDTLDEYGDWVTQYPTIYQIIQEVVSHYGGEQLGKIIISDVDTRIKKVMKWIGSTPLYIGVEMGDGVIKYNPTTNRGDLADYPDDAIKTYEYGMDVGYIYTDFIYPSELMADTGSSVCDVLDKIKNTLGNYEYFYDLDGNFVFQEVKNYLNTTQATVELQNMQSDDYIVDMSRGKAVYNFEDGVLITSYANNPQYGMIKNDYVVWGSRELSSGEKLPIRYHLAIDSKPKIGNTYPVYFYIDPTDNIKKAKVAYMYNSQTEFPAIGEVGKLYYAADNKLVFRWDAVAAQYRELALEMKEITTTDWRTELYLSGTMTEIRATDSNPYYIELANEWPKIYDVENGEFYQDASQTPSDIDYFLDFIDSSAAISEFSISNVGRRTKAIVDDAINCLFEPEIPNYILLNNADENLNNLRAECERKGEDFIQLDENVYNMLTGGGSSNSAYNRVRELLYQHTNYNETASITMMPVYYLEPNIRITARDAESGISGDYMINSFSLPLDINGTMTLSCIKAIERF